MKKLLLILSVLLVSINGFAQFHFEDGAVYCDLDYLIIGRIQANFDDNDVLMTVYPQSKDYLKNNVRLFCSEKNLGSGIILLNNLNYFNKILVKYPTVRFKERKQAER